MIGNANKVDIEGVISSITPISSTQKYNVEVKIANGETISVLAASSTIDGAEVGMKGSFQYVKKFKGQSSDGAKYDAILTKFAFKGTEEGSTDETVEKEESLPTFATKIVKTSKEVAEVEPAEESRDVVDELSCFDIFPDCSFDENKGVSTELDFSVLSEVLARLHDKKLANDLTNAISKQMSSLGTKTFKGTDCNIFDALATISNVAVELATDDVNTDALIFGAMVNVFAYTNYKKGLGSWALLKLLLDNGINLLDMPEEYQVAVRTLYDNKKYDSKVSVILYEATQAYKNTRKEG